MRSLLLLAALSAPAAAGTMSVGQNAATDIVDLIGQLISPSVVNASTMTLNLSTMSLSSAFPYSPLMIFGNSNTYLQLVMQNLSNGNNASSDLIMTTDLGGDTSFYLDIGMNSSKFSQAGQTVEQSSSAFVTSSDSDLVLWSMINGGLNSGVNGRIIFGSSNPVSANTAAYIGLPTTSLPGPFVVTSSFSVVHSSGANFVSGLNTPIITGGGALYLSTATTLATASNKNLNVNSSGQVTFSVPLSSFNTTVALSGTYTNTTLTACITNSTITFTLPVGTAGLIHVDFRGTASVATLAAVLGAGLIVDGAPVDGESSTKGMTAPLEAVSGDGTNLSFSTTLSGLSAATHNICLSLFVSAGTGTIDSTNSSMKLSGYTLP